MSIRTRKIDAIIIIAMIIIAGFIFYRLGYIFDHDGPDIPDIQFKKDDQEKTLTVVSLSDQVLWKDIEIIGDCDTSALGKYVSEGDQIIQCEGTITIRHVPTKTILSTWKFSAIENLQLKHVHYTGPVSIKMAKSYIRLGQNYLALNDIPNAYANFQKGYKIALTSKRISAIVETSKGLADTWEQKGNIDVV